MNIIRPVWPAPASIHSLVTTRQAGSSSSPYDSLNLGDHVGDEPSCVIANREALRKYLPAEPLWLKQTHSITVSTPKNRVQFSSGPLEADAAVSNVPEDVLVILTADCLPVLLTSADGKVIGAAHAGWRGLCDGILENTVSEMLKLSDQSSAADWIAWMGPAIGPESFEVGQDVVGRFAESGVHDMKKCFVPITNKPGKYLADIYQLARERLMTVGVNAIYGGDLCTLQDGGRFFSYRRDGVTGRFASLIWISK